MRPLARVCVLAIIAGSFALAACTVDSNVLTNGQSGDPSVATDPTSPADPTDPQATPSPSNSPVPSNDASVPSTPKPDGGTQTKGDAGAPDTGPVTPPPPAGFDAFQQHNLVVINQYRAASGIAPLTLDLTISTFALAGTTELSQDHSPHAHFMSAGGSIWSSGFSGSAAENQGDPNGWMPLASDPTQNEMLQIDAIQKMMFDEGPGGGHHDNIMNPQLKKLGVGLLMINRSLYLTNDFSG